MYDQGCIVRRIGGLMSESLQCSQRSSKFLKH